jgi:hypothetical protein
MTARHLMNYPLTPSVILVSLLALTNRTPAQESVRQYLSGRDAEHPATWEFVCSAGRNSVVWTNIAVPS